MHGPTTLYHYFIFRDYITFSEHTTLIASLPILNLIGNIAVILSDALAFLGVIRQIWGLWKEKRSLHLQTNADLVDLLLQQGILRFSFVSLVAIVASLIEFFSPLVGSNLAVVQNVLSALLICEFTLALRQRNAKKAVPNQSALELELPNLNSSFLNNPMHSIQTVFGHIHESIITDMGERIDRVGIDGQGDQV
ncbi:hypothetical protein Clacol_004330 [Clathrus columnatus]|uniref:Uncharacterized protein n=1 Tax=Clathrus columnatus TaxID=1419009 RepID=A0AAV5ABL3_9AGAM|nr:hypothetical protein Clacol_004330 [Clathrus columnatus]